MNSIEELKEKIAWLFQDHEKWEVEAEHPYVPAPKLQITVEEARLVLDLIEITQEFKDLYETKGDHVRKVKRMIDLNRKVEALGIIGF